MREQRIWQLDRIRGLAIVLMLLDHVLALNPSVGGMAVRLSLTRFAMPLFMMTAGYLIASKRSAFSARRLSVIAAAGVVSCTCCWSLSLPTFDILVGFAFVVMVTGAVVRWPLLLVLVGFIQAAWLPLHFPAYELGAVVAWVSIGALIVGSMHSGSFLAWADRVPRVLEPIGRYPLRWYVGHLVVLAVMVLLMRT